jgi:outer membrane protein assembly factor BamB
MTESATVNSHNPKISSIWKSEHFYACVNTDRTSIIFTKEEDFDAFRLALNAYDGSTDWRAAQ